MRLAAYVHHFIMKAKRDALNCDTTVICILVKGLWDAHKITANVYKKGCQNLLEVIKLVERLNIVQQVTVTLSPTTVNMMSNDDRCFACGLHCSHAQCYNNDGFGNFTLDCSEKFPYQENFIIMTDCTPNHIMTKTAGTDYY